MRFVDLSPSTSWAALKYQGTTIAEVWFKPADEPQGLLLRIPHMTFQATGLKKAPSAEQLLNAVGIASEEVDSWRLEGASTRPKDGFGFTQYLAAPLPPPSVDSKHLLVHVRLKSNDDVAPAVRPSDERERSERLQDLEARWKILLGLESNIESLRLRMDAIRGEMEAAAKRPLAAEEKLNALQADVAQLTRAKNRVHFSAPKAKEYIHRATWMLGDPERKQLEEIYTKHVESPATNPEPVQLESMIKDRNIFLTQGNSVYQECRSVINNIQSALRTLQINAVALARKKKPPR